MAQLLLGQPAILPNVGKDDPEGRQNTMRLGHPGDGRRDDAVPLQPERVIHSRRSVGLATPPAEPTQGRRVQWR